MVFGVRVVCVVLVSMLICGSLPIDTRWTRGAVGTAMGLREDTARISVSAGFHTALGSLCTEVQKVAGAGGILEDSEGVGHPEFLHSACGAPDILCNNATCAALVALLLFRNSTDSRLVFDLASFES